MCAACMVNQALNTRVVTDLIVGLAPMCVWRLIAANIVHTRPQRVHGKVQHQLLDVVVAIWPAAGLHIHGLALPWGIETHRIRMVNGTGCMEQGHTPHLAINYRDCSLFGMKRYIECWYICIQPVVHHEVSGVVPGPVIGEHERHSGPQYHTVILKHLILRRRPPPVLPEANTDGVIDLALQTTTSPINPSQRQQS